MSHPQAQINPEVLRWARGRMGVDIGAAATAAGGAAAAGAGSGAVERSEHEKKFDRQIR
ncbi:MAG: hypothetical protein ACOVOD_01375 [Rhodoferax sp.]